MLLRHLLCFVVAIDVRRIKHNRLASSHIGSSVSALLPPSVGRPHVCQSDIPIIHRATTQA